MFVFLSLREYDDGRAVQDLMNGNATVQYEKEK